VLYSGDLVYRLLSSTVEELLWCSDLNDLDQRCSLYEEGEIGPANFSRWQSSQWVTGLLLLPEGCEGYGWSHFAVELNKVMAFFEATISPSGALPLAEKKVGKKAWLGLRFDPALHGGERSLLVEGMPLYADAVRSVASSSASFGEQLDKNRHVGGNSLDKDP
jgi:hypothetical protein